ncbi:hypothetical protein [Streptomyces murinus]|uniref:hypothetical protein n=1 Tax=Streptomyces murinus TaxID=33900 RepID=UPI0018F2A12B|nr:hypothetical protein [Streptomyces murinus]
MTKKKEPTDYGPIQFPDRLGLQQWEFERAQALGLIPAADVAFGSRWSAAVVADAMSRLDEIRAAVGTQPDVGAWRAAEVLTERFGHEVTADAVMELGRRNLIPVVGEYKGHAMYDGRALERFDDREALDAAAHAGQLYSKNAAAAYLRIRPADLDHLLRAGLLEEKHRVRSWNQPKRAYPAVPLYRRGDLDELLARTDLDWAQAQATPKGRPSPFAKLPDKEPVSA